MLPFCKRHGQPLFAAMHEQRKIFIVILNKDLTFLITNSMPD